MLIYINGKFLPKEEAKVSVLDHGYLYGDGVFEGIRIYSGCIFKLKEHIDRLYNSARAIMLDIPMSKDELISVIVDTVKKNNLSDGYIRVVVSRGIGDLGLDPRKCSHPTVVVIADKIKLYPEELYKNGLEIITVPVRRNIPEAVNPQVKSLNYLNNILAKIEAIHRGYEEALMLNHEGYVAECTGDNIFLVRGNVLLTPPTSVGVLKGITAQTVMEIALDMGMEVREERFTRYDLYVAEEVFLTGTAAEIIPVVKIDDRIIGNGRPGPKTWQIIERFRKLTTVDGVKVQ